MKKVISSAACAALMCSAIAPISPALADTPVALNDLIGARGSSADSELAARGYKSAGTLGSAVLWWNKGNRTCVSVAVNNGRIASIERASAKDCGKDGGGDKALAGIAAGAVAIGLIAALSSHHDRDDHRDNNAGYNAEYERGYNDAMYGAHYSNRDSEAYHSGYLAGETERNNRRHANSSIARSLPGAAGNACISRGEYEWGVYPGSVSVVSSRQNGGGEWEATLATGNWRARCRVTADGRVMAFQGL